MRATTSSSRLTRMCSSSSALTTTMREETSMLASPCRTTSQLVLVSLLDTSPHHVHHVPHVWDRQRTLTRLLLHPRRLPLQVQASWLVTRQLVTSSPLTSLKATRQRPVMTSHSQELLILRETMVIMDCRDSLVWPVNNNLVWLVNNSPILWVELVRNSANSVSNVGRDLFSQELNLQSPLRSPLQPITSSAKPNLLSRKKDVRLSSRDSRPNTLVFSVSPPLELSTSHPLQPETKSLRKTWISLLKNTMTRSITMSTVTTTKSLMVCLMKKNRSSSMASINLTCSSNLNSQWLNLSNP